VAFHDKVPKADHVYGNLCKIIVNNLKHLLLNVCLTLKANRIESLFIKSFCLFILFLFASD